MTLDRIRMRAEILEEQLARAREAELELRDTLDAWVDSGYGNGATLSRLTGLSPQVIGHVRRGRRRPSGVVLGRLKSVRP